MSKKAGLGLAGLIVIGFILFVGQAQTEEQGWKKTITLPSGEVVCDLNGEWEGLTVFKGRFRNFSEDLRTVSKIIQQGNSFKSTRISGDPFNPPGAVLLEGEIDKNGTIKFICESCGSLGGQKEYQTRLSKDGNLIEYSDRGNNFSTELKRK